jgi:hypothetical protein
VTVKLIWIPLVSSVICDFHLQHGRINRRNDKHIAPLLGELASNIKLDGPIVLVSLDLQRTLLSALQRVPGSTVFALEGVVEAEIERRH